VEGETYGVTTCGAGLDLRLAGPEITGQARQLDTEGYVVLYTIVVMPDHCHMVFRLQGDATLDGVMQLLKGRSARAANQRLGRRGSMWRRAFFEHLMHSPDETYHAWWYTLNNPVRRGLVENWEEYPFTYTVPYPEERVSPPTGAPW
jgi:REP element-mobilizing transposase RayT